MQRKPYPSPIVHYKFSTDWSGIATQPPQWQARDCLSHGMAHKLLLCPGDRYSIFPEHCILHFLSMLESFRYYIAVPSCFSKHESISFSGTGAVKQRTFC